MILLPKSTSRGALRALWLILSVGVGLMAATLLAATGGALWALGGVAIAVMVAVPGLLRPFRVRPAYRAWNGAARTYAAAASRVVTGVCFFTVFLTVGRGAGPARFLKESRNGSMWVPRQTQPGSAYASQDGRADVDHSSDRWVSTVREWAGGSGNGWAVALIPFLWALRLLAVDGRQGGQDPLPTDVYTLY